MSGWRYFLCNKRLGEKGRESWLRNGWRVGSVSILDRCGNQASRKQKTAAGHPLDVTSWGGNGEFVLLGVLFSLSLPKPFVCSNVGCVKKTRVLIYFPHRNPTHVMWPAISPTPRRPPRWRPAAMPATSSLDDDISWVREAKFWEFCGFNSRNWTLGASQHRVVPMKL